MKKQGLFILISIFILILAACGQGSNQTGSQPETNGIESTENDDLTDVDENEDENEDEDAETATDDEPEATDDHEEDQDGAEETNSENPGSSDGDVKETPIELIFSDDQVMDMYRVERTVEASDDDLFIATLEAWVAGPTEEGLVSLLPDGVKVQSVDEKDGVAHVSFSPEFLNAQVGSGTEAMLLQQVALAMKQFGFNETQILVDGEIHPELFGHIETDVPIVADSLENFEKVE